MNSIYLLLALAILFAIGATIFSKFAKPKPRLPYVRRDLLTPHECDLLAFLAEHLGSRYVVASQVHFASLMEVERGAADRRTHFNRIIQKSVDFALVTRPDTRPALGIELDDRTHEQPSRIDRDGFADEAFAAAGIPLLHVRHGELSNPAALLGRIEAALAGGSGVTR